MLSKWGEEKYLVMSGSPCSLPVELVLASSSMGLQSPYIIIQVAGHHHHHHHHSIGIIITIIFFFPLHQFLKATAIISIFIEPVDEQQEVIIVIIITTINIKIIKFGCNCSRVIPHRTEPVQCKPKYG